MPDDFPACQPAIKIKAPRKRRLLSLVCWLVFGFFFVVAASLIAVEATEQYGAPDACAECHEMTDVHESWAASPHHTNPSGVKVTCISCHLPPREDHFAHLTSKALSGMKDMWVHSFGEYDGPAARARVLDTLPSERCLHCHDNLAAMPSSPEVGIVHASAVAEVDNRAHACVACHDALHGPKAPAPTAASVEYEDADNSFCFVCHINYQTESFAEAHRAVGVGCIACHGDSREHEKDEDHRASPDVMYAKAQVNSMCTTEECHGEEAVKALVGHRPFYAGAEPKRQRCTDCHGTHRMTERVRRWDKETGKLIWRDGYTMEEWLKTDAATQQADPDDPDMGGM